MCRWPCPSMRRRSCCNQIHDPAVLREELADLAAIRSGILNTDDGNEPAGSDAALGVYADRAEALLGTAFAPRTDEWKQGDDPAEYAKLFLVRIGAYLDDGFECSEPMTDSAAVTALARRGNVLRFQWNGQFLYGIYLGDGLLAYADAERLLVRNAYVTDWLNDKEGKPGCTCSVLTWR